MLVLCLGLIMVGALIMAVSIVLYYRVLALMRRQNYQKKVFQRSLYSAALAMMVFFLIGYLFIGVSLLTSKFEPYYFLISLIFFFGAIFVLCMVKVQQIMSHTIISQTTEMLQSMVVAMEAKDIYTRGHSEHVRKLVKLLYQHLPQQLRQGISLENLEDAAILHDIGKIGMPDSILKKPGKLTPEEMEIIRQHPKQGMAILENTCYREICGFILYHHEREDGNGYYHVPGDQIPLESKIIALADTFSSLYTNRVYRPKFTFEKAIEIIRENAGTQFDPVLAEVFCQMKPEEIKCLSEQGETHAMAEDGFAVGLHTE